MSSVSSQPSALSDQQRVNVADRLSVVARQSPDAIAVAAPGRGNRVEKNTYSTCTFAELERDASALARGLVDLGVKPGTRLVLLVRPGSEFVKLVFALLRSGATTVLIDPGMGRRHLINCLAAVDPEGFVAISPAQAVRTVLRRRFPQAKLNVTVGRRWFWGGLTYQQLLQRGQKSTPPLPCTNANDPAAIIYTSGSTGPPKGVLYTHQMFDTQVAEISGHYGLRPGGIDLACFPLFGLFNSAMGVTTVFPDMDFSRPASADPTKLLAAANDWQVTQAFASPAVWSKLSQFCETHGQSIPTLRQVFSCGAPVPANVLRRTLACVGSDAQMHTPYGATECLPIATIEAAEVLNETSQQTNNGAGVCVGRKFDTIHWRVIRITDEPIATINECEELPNGEIGELIVRGPQVSPIYTTVSAVGNDERPTKNPTPTHNTKAKITDNNTIWHRMGDVGYFDNQQRFWYCGRKAHRVEWGDEVFYSIPCEAVFNTSPRVQRSALVRFGPQFHSKPALVVELVKGDRAIGQTTPDSALVEELFAIKQQHLHLSGIDHLFVHPQLPVDVRHNSKINREALGKWALQQLRTKLDLPTPRQIS